MTGMDTITISYRRRPAARAGAERFWLAAHIEALPDGDVVKQLVAFMALYARDILHGELPGPYSDTRALEFARLALVDPDTYAAHHADSDAQLAARARAPSRPDPRRAPRPGAGANPNATAARPSVTRSRRRCANTRTSACVAPDRC